LIPVCIAMGQLMAADPIPSDVGVVGVHIARPVGEDISRLMTSRAMGASCDTTSLHKPFSGSAVLLEAEIPAIYGLTGDEQVVSFADDAGANLIGPGCSAMIVHRPGIAEVPTGGQSSTTAQFSVSSPRLPRQGARKLEGSILVPVFLRPSKTFSTLDGQCTKGAIFESKYVQCQILSRDPLDRADGSARSSTLGKKLAREAMSFEISTPGAGVYAGPTTGSRSCSTDYDRVRMNMRIRLLKVEVIDSLGGRVIAEVDGINPDANKQQNHLVEIPASAGNIRFRFSYYEIASVVMLQLFFSSDLGLAVTP